MNKASAARSPAGDARAGGSLTAAAGAKSTTLSVATNKADARVADANGRRDDAPIIVHCHLRWEGVWQRPQQFLSRISKTHRVLFCEGPRLVENNDAPSFQLLEVPNFPNVTVMQTFFPSSRFHEAAWVDAERLRL